MGTGRESSGEGNVPPHDRLRVGVGIVFGVRKDVVIDDAADGCDACPALVSALPPLAAIIAYGREIFTVRQCRRWH